MPKWSARQVLPDWFEITFSHPRHGAQRHLLSRTAAAALAAHLANELATPYGGAHSTPPKDSAAWN